MRYRCVTCELMPTKSISRGLARARVYALDKNIDALSFCRWAKDQPMSQICYAIDGLIVLHKPQNCLGEYYSGCLSTITSITRRP